MSAISLQQGSNCVVGQFRAMASPCEILLEQQDQALCGKLTQLAAQEAQRIEQKYSRYRSDSVLSQLNQHTGQWQHIDAETAALLQFANTCYTLSAGLFDISSGILRRAWQFDGSDNIASQQQLDTLLPFIGWHKVRLDANQLFLPEGMELDLGGIAKEYAVDKVLQLLSQQFSAADLPGFVVNFGGDMACNRPRDDGSLWRIGIDKPSEELGIGHEFEAIIQLNNESMATSGNYRNFKEQDGVKYVHTINPKTGWPEVNNTLSVSVIAKDCATADAYATAFMVMGVEQSISFIESHPEYTEKIRPFLLLAGEFELLEKFDIEMSYICTHFLAFCVSVSIKITDLCCIYRPSA